MATPKAEPVTISEIQPKRRSPRSTFLALCRQAKSCQMKKATSTGGKMKFISALGMKTTRKPMTAKAMQKVGR